eukprot:TRINITY_DN11949_c0_g1_i1.p1 TRINITY_DN11949_c0_g1~~TRINITY_DN11949_c0_g1_i1.p1  ORF type:complete len:490 (-),score=94.19 TRINITY_DN11949_c0_g1_i1:184-1653(-)
MEPPAWLLENYSKATQDVIDWPLLHAVAGRYWPPPPRGSAQESDMIEKILSTADQLCDSRSKEWFDLSLDDRITVLSRVPEHITRDVIDAMAVADSWANGIPLSFFEAVYPAMRDLFSRESLKALAASIRYPDGKTQHGALRQTLRPHGPALIIAPWNVPVPIVVPKVLAALLVGCPVIVKPSEVAPKGLQIFLKAVGTDAKLPNGILQWVHGGPEIGDILVNDHRLGTVNFTGSFSVGVKVALACAKHLVPVHMELGGSNVAIVLQDADLDVAAKAVAQGLCMLNGQCCAGVSRIFVHECHGDSFREKLLTELGTYTLGRCIAKETKCGPLVSAEHRDRMEGILKSLVERGGTAHRACDGCDLDGFFFVPTVVDGIPGDSDADEIFGPMATLAKFQNVDDVLRQARLRPLLQSYVFGKDEASAMLTGKRLRCGQVLVNGCNFGFDMPEGVEEPHVGFFKGAGIGLEAGVAGLLRFFASPQNVGVHRNG